MTACPGGINKGGAPEGEGVGNFIDPVCRRFLNISFGEIYLVVHKGSVGKCPQFLYITVCPQIFNFKFGLVDPHPEMAGGIHTCPGCHYSSGALGGTRQTKVKVWSVVFLNWCSRLGGIKMAEPGDKGCH